MYEVSKEKLKILREKYPPGTRVRLNVMRDEPQMRAGLKGTVYGIDDMGQLEVHWENGSGLALIPGVDIFQKVQEPLKEKITKEPSR